jgi:hypothetical protein
MVPFIEDVIVECAQELAEDHAGSSFWIPDRMRKTCGGRELRIHEEERKGREHQSAKDSHFSYSKAH